ncbi:MAG: carbohydrate kinase [Rubellimicrobium sp.]|nr:carbohydrate kinase [Rubellimicrobium sp.]
MRALIGIDIGTTALKAVMTDDAGARLADYRATYPLSRPHPGWAEQAPSDWWTHVLAALGDFARHPAAGAVAAIGVTSQVNTHVFCGADLTPLAPAVVWQDSRARDEATALDARLTEAQRIAALGAPLPIDPSHALARMAWMAAHEAGLWEATRHVLAPKDWVIARLCGRVAADPVASVGLVGTDLAYAGAVLDLLPRARQVLPPLADPLDVAGRVAAGLPFAGVPVAVGTMDAWASMFGVGVVREGQAMNLSGTSEVLGVISATRNPVPGAITFAPWRGITLHAGPTASGGASLDWVARLIGRTVPEAAALAERVEPAPDSPLFLPHLNGERAPLWDPQARGTFAGLAAGHGPGEVVLAVMEGVVFSARLALGVLEASGGIRPEVVQGGGGGTASDRWCRMRADAFGRPFLRMAAQDAGAVGATVMAGVAAGIVPDLAAAAAALVPVDRLFEPDPERMALADRRFALWRELYAQVRPINAGLAGGGGGA